MHFVIFLFVFMWCLCM